MPQETESKASSWELLRLVVFYVGFTALLILIITHNVARFLPTHMAKQVSDNSEGYLLGAVACAWLHWVRPWSHRRGWVAPVAIVGGLAFLGLALICKEDHHLRVTVATLNEAFFGLAFLAPYVALRRPLRWAPLFSVALVIGLFAAHNTSIVFKGAEAWVVLVLAPLGFDLFDRAILEPDVRESHGLRLLWMAILIAVPVGAAILRGHVGSGDVEGIRDYISRANEAFVGIFIIHFYFGYWARRALAARTTVPRAVSATKVTAPTG